LTSPRTARPPDRALGDGIDLILLDIGLPELDGLEVCRRSGPAGTPCRC